MALVYKMGLFLFLLISGAAASNSVTESEAHGNPIRRIVTLLQNMAKEVQAEGEKEKELYDKFMCFCENGTAEMTKAAEDAKLKIQQLQSEIEENTAEKTRTDQELVQHKKDREEAKSAIKKATAIREKEKAAYDKEAADFQSNIDAMNRAIPALEKGMAGGAALLQAKVLSGAMVQRLRNIAFDNQSLDPYDRQQILSFFSLDTQAGYAPQSGQIVGILKQMKEEMDKDLGGIVEVEEAAVKSFEELVSAKEAEIAAASQAIEAKTERSGKLAVAIVQGKADLEDTTAELGDAEKYAANLAVECDAKKKEWAERVKTRNEEIMAIGEAIKILNDDDALDTFKKTAASFSQEPAPGASSFLQGRFRQNAADKPRAKALSILQEAASVYRSTALDTALLFLRSRKVSFDKVLKLIDDMIVHLGEEQKDDDKQKAFCERELDTTDDKKKELEGVVATLGVEIDEAKESIGQLTEELAGLEQSVKDLDQSVAAATEQRKAENAEFVQAQAELTAAVELIEKAKNKLYKFYNPALYKPPPKREMTEEERIASNLGEEIDTSVPAAVLTQQPFSFLQKTKGLLLSISRHSSSKKTSKVAPPEAPETFGSYEKKGEKSQGVIHLMDMMKRDLETEAQEAAHDEKTAQEDYNKLMEDSSAQRAQYATSITNDEAAKANLEGNLQDMKSDRKSNAEALDNVKTEIADLHQNCDFLLENYDFRQTARATEMDALKNAKAALKGAKFD